MKLCKERGKTPSCNNCEYNYEPLNYAETPIMVKPELYQIETCISKFYVCTKFEPIKESL